MKIKKNIYPTKQECDTPLKNNSEISPSDFRSDISDVLDTIKLFEDGKQINSYSDRDAFLKDYESLQKKIESLQKEYHTLYHEEVDRVIKEFDFKSYAKKYKTSCGTVLSALFGIRNANKELLRYGMMGK